MQNSKNGKHFIERVLSNRFQWFLVKVASKSASKRDSKGAAKKAHNSCRLEGFQDVREKNDA